jgi:hypothetical protein
MYGKEQPPTNPSVDRYAAMGGCCGLMAAVVVGVAKWDGWGKQDFIGIAILLLVGFALMAFGATGGAIFGHYLGPSGGKNGNQ